MTANWCGLAALIAYGAWLATTGAAPGLVWISTVGREPSCQTGGPQSAIAVDAGISTARSRPGRRIACLISPITTQGSLPMLTTG